tara:strand:- start:7492 stop:7686 length:195 start_codon:yes stop_codon:yes gene_type:complete
MGRKSQYETMMERLEAEGKVKRIPPEQTDAIFEGIRKALEEYRAKDKIMQHQSEKELWNIILNS